jgi:phosphoglycerol transferase
MNLGRYDYLVDEYSVVHPLSLEEDISKYLDALMDKNYTILISARDAATRGLDADLRSKLARLGIESELDGNYWHSFIAVIDNRQIIYEEISEEALEHSGYLPNGMNYIIKSAGNQVGNNSSIVISGVECSVNRRGLNFVVFDNSTGRIIDYVNFDTHTDLTVHR